MWDTGEYYWEKGFAALLKYKNREGDCLVPRHHIEEGYPIGGWVNKQRAAKREGRLSAARIRKLNSIGFEWNPRGRR